MTTSEQKTFEFLQGQLFSESGWELDQNVTQKEGWLSIVILDYPDEGLVKNICETSIYLGFGDIVLINYGGKSSQTEIQEMVPNTESVYNYIFDHSFQSVYMTTMSIDFVFYKSQDNAYSVLAGEPDFIHAVLGNELIKYKRQYFEEIKGQRPEAISNFDKIWQNYAKIL